MNVKLWSVTLKNGNQYEVFAPNRRFARANFCEAMKYWPELLSQIQSIRPSLVK
jgi:hypothetical protein